MREIDLSQLASEFSRITGNVAIETEKALNVVAEDLLSESIDLAPLDEGGLRESGSVNPAERRGNEYVAEVGFNTEYALRMHEDFYNPQYAGTGRKYLEKPTIANADNYNKYIASKIEEGLDE